MQRQNYNIRSKPLRHKVENREFALRCALFNPLAFGYMLLGVSLYLVHLIGFEIAHRLLAVPPAHNEVAELADFGHAAALGKDACQLRPRIKAPARTEKVLFTVVSLAPPKGTEDHYPDAFVRYYDVFGILPEPQLYG